MAICAGLAGQSLEILPDLYLRGWDPITITLEGDYGPADGGPLDSPGDLFSLNPYHPGEYRWLDARTIQFLPAEAWPPLKEYSIKSLGLEAKISTLMNPPSSLSPSSGSTGLEPLSKIVLTFRQQVNPNILSELITFQIRPLPGVGTEGETWLSGNDFSLKSLDMTAATDRYKYQITLREPVDYGMDVVLHLRLALDPTIPGAAGKYSFKTRQAFRLTSVGSGSMIYPIASQGSVYTLSQAMSAGTGRNPIYLEFSESISSPGIGQVKRLVQFQPSVRNFRFEQSGSRLYLYFDSDRNVPYRLSVTNEPIRSRTGRLLQNPGNTSLYFYYQQLPPYISWNAGQAIVERYGPQLFPMQGRGTDKVDLRIYPIDPLDRRFWPFPQSPVTVNEQSRPLMPGEESLASSIEQHIKLLSSPDVSSVVDLPIGESSGQSRFGLDLSRHLESISGISAPGTYLVGYRSLGGSENRYYVRLQVTDLSLSTIEEEHGVMFVVTSLKDGSPKEGARIVVEGLRNNRYVSVISGKTDSDGRFYFGHDETILEGIRRIRVEHGDDILVLDPSYPPPTFMNNHWYGSGGSWLGWLNRDPVTRREEAVNKGYIFSDRPIYRPQEVVHLSGYVRIRKQGKIQKDPEGETRTLIIRGPGGNTWEYNVELKAHGQFYQKFEEEEIPTGSYRAELLDYTGRQVLDSLFFMIESYRIPRFEAQISGPDRVRLDEPFELLLTADYYAGGRVVGQQVTWSVSRYPYVVSSPAFPGFLFASDERFTGRSANRTVGSSVHYDVTDENGSATLTLNPRQENEGQPIRYIVEATVRGADRMTVSTTHQVKALPPFMLGLYHPRIIKDGTALEPKIVVLGHDEMPVEGQPFTLRIYRREWHSYLSESDFTTGDARYVSDVVDRKIYEEQMVSRDEIMEFGLPVDEAGVYVIEILARDSLGRLQLVKTDTFLEGEEAVAWEKTDANVFETVPDKVWYEPGDRARILLKSPYQNARALAVVEGPTENEYQWVQVAGGQAVFEFDIQGEMAPRIPVHFLLMRGRLPGTGAQTGRVDRGKPAAMASTRWLAVVPKDNRLNVSLKHEAQQQPGTTLKVDITLTDPDGRALDGEVALWLVDRAVLSLAPERFINPLDRFIDQTYSSLRFRETRNMVVGNLPVEETAGGGWGFEDRAAASEAELLDQVTVRKTFQTVPYFNPWIEVKNGTATVYIGLPDNLTEFAIRAIAVSGYERFGNIKSLVTVRLPLIVQSALPRFVRPGDSFSAGGIGRVVEGDGGPGRAQVRTLGLTIDGEINVSRDVDWRIGLAEQLYFPFEVPKGMDDGDKVRIIMGVERFSDNASDAFQIDLPVRRDMHRIYQTEYAEPERGDVVRFPDPTSAIRQGTRTQSIIATGEEAFLKMINGLHLLKYYEHFCTEQRISRIYPTLALKSLFEDIDMPDTLLVPEEVMEEILEFLPSTLTEDGLFGFWPGSEGYVSLTAYVVEFLVLAKELGIQFDQDLLLKPVQALKEALRSDYRNLIRDYAFRERVDAMAALSAYGYFDENYANDLLIGSLNGDIYSKARMITVYLKEGRKNNRDVKTVLDDLWDHTVFRLRDGNEIFAGFQYVNTLWGGILLTSELRTQAEVIRALLLADPDDARLRLMVDDLIDVADDRGWGSTRTNVAALTALGDYFSEREDRRKNWIFRIDFKDRRESFSTEGKTIAFAEYENDDTGTALLERGPAEAPFVMLDTSFLPDGDGGSAGAESRGFAVTGELLFIENNRVYQRAPYRKGSTLDVPIDTIVEEHVTVQNDTFRNFVAINVPFAAGFEILNPKLATAPPEAAPSGRISRAPTYSIYGDDKVTFYYDALPAGTYHFYFRLRASFEGTFTQPQSRAELMYDTKVWGTSDGMKIRISEL